MTKSDIQFKIDQLRKDKIIYAVESIATTAAMIAAFLLLSIIYHPMLKSELLNDMLPNIFMLVAIGYWVYMGVGNFLRLKEIKRLEELLEK